MSTPMNNAEQEHRGQGQQGAGQAPDLVQEALGQEWPVISVRWIDAEARGGPGWEDPEDMVEFALRPLAEVHTVGLMIHACEQFIALTESRGPDQIGGVHKIPRAWIISMDLMVPTTEDAPPTLSMNEMRAG